MKKTIEERKEYAKVIAQAWVDEEFKKRLLKDTAAVLAENGIEIPEGMTLRFVVRQENEILVPLPPRPPQSAELSDEDLEKVAGGVHSPSQTPWLNQLKIIANYSPLVAFGIARHDGT